jgi:septal ring factor EnvC (AmiA/AmiB activator)
MLRDNASKIAATLPELQSELRDMQKQQEGLQAEMGTPLDTNLTPAETATLRDTEARIPELERDITAASKALEEKRSER